MRKALDGLVLRVVQSGDNDRRLLVLTADEGKMWLTAKGARSVRSKVAPLCRIFSYINFEYYEKGSLRWLSGGSLNNSFEKLNDDLTDFSLACYILQLADEITGENLPAEEILRTTLNTLYAIEARLKPRQQIKAAFELYAARASGLIPELWSCLHCDKQAFGNEEMLWLDVMNGSIVCGECVSRQGGNEHLPETDRFDVRNILLPLDSSALTAMRYIAACEPKRLFAFGLTDQKSLSLLSRACETYIVNHLERDFETLTFYNSIKDKK